ncbi:MAG: ergothioneine biosynthesis protein EgtB [Planctomycetes bacterium]|nr:ergothioneine biosynthesis protein EgtB [Planctomycetota bacterium]
MKITAADSKQYASTARLSDRYAAVRRFSETLCDPLETEDYVIQSMPDVSPTRWHLAHTTWFFETFVLSEYSPAYRPFHPDFVYLFNSYYNGIGDQFPRPRRGVLSRPTVKEVFAYRKHVDEHTRSFLDQVEPAPSSEIARTIEIGLNHEQQHQELMLTDIKHVFSCNPLFPAYRKRTAEAKINQGRLRWASYAEGLREFGYGGDGFSYDNERPRHRAFVHSFELATRLVTNGEFMAFMADGGYQRPDHWLSNGWATIDAQDWKAPLYWTKIDDTWWHYTLAGLCRIDPNEPVCHVNYFEADAYARWSGFRLPTEYEWEMASMDCPVEGNLVDRLRFHPAPSVEPEVNASLTQMFGDVWEWTASQYLGYPGYQPPAGALGEYNGKFMCNQFVLRGGSCATSPDHIRHTYRNFFPPEARWQFSGIRLAR